MTNSSVNGAQSPNFSAVDGSIKKSAENNFVNAESSASAGHTPPAGPVNSNAPKHSSDRQGSEDENLGNKRFVIEKTEKTRWQKIKDWFPGTKDAEFAKFSMYDHFVEELIKISRGAKAPDDLLIDTMIMAMCLPFEKIKAICDKRVRIRREEKNGTKAKSKAEKLQSISQLLSSAQAGNDHEIFKTAKDLAGAYGYKISERKAKNSAQEAGGPPDPVTNKEEYQKYYIEQVFKTMEDEKIATEFINDNTGSVKKILLDQGGIKLDGSNADELRASFMRQVSDGTITPDKLKCLETFTKNMDALQQAVDNPNASQKDIQSSIASRRIAQQFVAAMQQRSNPK